MLSYRNNRCYKFRSHRSTVRSLVTLWPSLEIIEKPFELAIPVIPIFRSFWNKNLFEMQSNALEKSNITSKVTFLFSTAKRTSSKTFNKAVCVSFPFYCSRTAWIPRASDTWEKLNPFDGAVAKMFIKFFSHETMESITGPGNKPRLRCFFSPEILSAISIVGTASSFTFLVTQVGQFKKFVQKLPVTSSASSTTDDISFLYQY